MNSQNKQPAFFNRKDIIKLSNDLKCSHCTRIMYKPHCPGCGSREVRSVGQPMPALMPNGIDTLLDCATFKCRPCSITFTDIDWYFKCEAPIEIDWVATNRMHKQRAFKEQWDARVESSIDQQYKFTYNEVEKCKAEAGFNPNEKRKQIIEGRAVLKRFVQQDPIELTKSQISFNEDLLKQSPNDEELKFVISLLQEKLKKLEDEQNNKGA